MDKDKYRFWNQALISMIPISKPAIGEEEKKAVLEVLESGMLAQGPKVKLLENDFARFIGVEHAIATSSGTTAIHVMFLSAGIEPGDEVITTPLSFFATVSPILFCRAKPVFADVQEDGFNISPDEIRKKITPKTKAIFPVHLYGQPADMKEINEIAVEHDLFVLEDACQAHGATYMGKKAGNLGHAATFSLYPTKNMVAAEGGIITTNDDIIAKNARLLRDHGSEKKYHHSRLGYNFRTTDLSAAIALAQLPKLEGFNNKRRENARRLNELLGDHAVIPVPRPDRTHVYHQYCLLVNKRDKLVEFLRVNGIGATPGYPMPLYEQEIVKQFVQSEECPTAKEIIPKMLLLPIHPQVTMDDIEIIAEKVVEGQKRL